MSSASCATEDLEYRKTDRMKRHPYGKILHSMAAVIMTASMLTGCVHTGSMNEADFDSTISDVSLTVGGKECLKYDSRIHQIAYDNGKRQFRVMDDDLDNYFVITLDRIPQNVGETVSATLVYTTEDDIISIRADFTLSRYTDGKLWLWNGGNHTGVVVEELH